jgi:RHS repeat-associated protein
VANAYTYDGFGNLVASSGSIVNNFRYTGREWDPETSLYYYRARYYDPATGRFLREDPARFLGRDQNFYRYVWNSSASYRDPAGLLGVGMSLGGGAFGGFGPGVGVNGSLTAFYFGHIEDSGVAYTDTAFAGAHGFCKSYDNNQTGGLSFGAGPGIVFTSANSIQEVSGPFNNTTYALGLLQVDFAYSPDNGVWTLNVSPGYGLGFSKNVTNTITSPTSPPQGCSCN